MKKIFNVTGIFALLAIMTLGVASCKQKDEPTNQTTNQQTTQPANQQTGTEEPTIVGTWEVILMQAYYSEEDVIENLEHENIFFTFDKDNSGLMVQGGTSRTFTYTLASKRLIIKWNDGNAFLAEIKELTKDVLVLRQTDGDDWSEVTCKRIK